ncbi:MAG TPA: flagellar biosynthetic protein FliO [Terriglobia bacterium]|nr:flagellar biosynthetic protein FliO [Terriglobia bacterium]
MDGESYLRFVLALVLVLGLLALAAFFLRRSGIGPKLGRGRRLSAVETLPLGPRHRLVLVRRDEVEHLILIGPQGDVVVESGIGGTAGSFAKVLEDRSGTDADTRHTTSTDERN